VKYHESGWHVLDFMTGPGSYLTRSGVIEVALPFIKGRGLVVQAGGHIGIWPKKLAEHFKMVITVEPEPRNVQCCKANTEGLAVTVIDGVLGARAGVAKVNHRELRTGAHHIATNLRVQWMPVQMFTIDGLTKGLGSVDALFLDIEGYELEALHGATRALSDKPTVVIEQNSCSLKYGTAQDAAELFLKGLGYRRVGTFDEDVILVCE
jgi:FkbM family methyltransferase